MTAAHAGSGLGPPCRGTSGRRDQWQILMADEQEQEQEETPPCQSGPGVKRQSARAHIRHSSRRMANPDQYGDSEAGSRAPPARWGGMLCGHETIGARDSEQLEAAKADAIHADEMPGRQPLVEGNIVRALATRMVRFLSRKLHTFLARLALSSRISTQALLTMTPRPLRRWR